MKLSRREAKLHDDAWSLVKKAEAGARLSEDDREFILTNWSPSANHNIGANGVYFTPLDMASDAMIETLDDASTVLDLCAGIGRLSFARLIHSAGKRRPSITCVELNPEFVRVGRVAVPEANWICGSMFDLELIKSLGQFDEVISNPPFGSVPKELRKLLPWNKGKLTYAAAQIAMRMSQHGVFILPQMDCPFRYSGYQHFTEMSEPAYLKFRDINGIAIEPSCGIDTTCCEAFDRANVKVEVVVITKSSPTAVAAERSLPSSLFEDHCHG